MSLSSELISQFAKITKDEKKAKEETTVYGTIREIDGTKYVQLDGSELLTPISAVTNVSNDERVTVLIKNHAAVVTGNMSSPSVRTGDIEDMTDEIAEFEIILADKVDTKEFVAEQARVDSLVADNVLIKQQITARDAEIENLKAHDLTVDNKLIANDADISTLKTNKLDATIADAKYATIESLAATDADIHNLEGTYSDFVISTTDKFEAIDAAIENIEAGNINTDGLDARYANIDFTNISKAAIENFYSESGLIEDIVVGDGTITGKLVGVTISGDLIEGNTVVAEKLVIKGEDGLYYKLNTDGVTTEGEQTDYNSLNGQVIKAKSITATQISVSDLVAFDATIGGFFITNHSIYSGAKESIDNSTQGIYMDDEGQIAFGDANNFLKCYKAADGSYKIEFFADTIFLSGGDIRSEVDSAGERLDVAESTIRQLANSIASLITDVNGTSLMTQTSDGWTFSTGEIQTTVDSVSESLEEIVSKVGDTSNAVDILQRAVSDLGGISEYVRVGTHEGEPCVELGENDSDFKLLITNTRIMFMDGSDVPAYINNKSLYIKKAVIEEELHQGGYSWIKRSNGHLSLVWKGAND